MNEYKKIKDILNLDKSGEVVWAKVVLVEKELAKTSTGSDMLNIKIADATGQLKTPVFSSSSSISIKQLDCFLVEGEVYEVYAYSNVWNGNVQLKNIAFKKLDRDECKRSDFISLYDIPEGNIVEFIDIIRRLKQPYKDIACAATGCGDEEGKYHNQKRFNSFIACPSAEKHHGAKLGGLFLHTFGMMKMLDSILEVYNGPLSIYGDVNEVIDRDKLMLKVCLHDIMKIKEYDFNTVIKRKKNVIGHLIDGVSYFEQIINSEGIPAMDPEMVEDIKYAILSHHGSYGPYEPKTTEDQILHQLDMIDSRIVGAIENK